MRTIKFRGKRIDTGEFVYGDLIHRNDGDVAIYTNLDTWGENPDDVDAYGDSFRVANSTVGQFTGLHDKNGRDIYEGDIICRKGLKIKHLIFYNEKQGRFMAALNGDTEDEDWCCGLDNNRWISSKEVIGNIHDNPELLKQQEL